jgi:hypothetical protein
MFTYVHRQKDSSPVDRSIGHALRDLFEKNKFVSIFYKVHRLFEQKSIFELVTQCVTFLKTNKFVRFFTYCAYYSNKIPLFELVTQCVAFSIKEKKKWFIVVNSSHYVHA